jgi:hypothetical protein
MTEPKELLSPKADFLAKLDYNRTVETSAKRAKIKLVLFWEKEKVRLVYSIWIWLGVRF